MNFWSWFVYLGLVAYCSSSLTIFGASATVYPSQARMACERNLNTDHSNATNLLSKSWVQVYSQEFLMLELHYRCSKSSRSSQGASGTVFDVIQVEAKHSRAVENICLDYQEESAHVILIYGGFNAYRMRALRTNSSERNCILLSSEFGLKTRFPVGQLCNNSIACKGYQVCSNGKCEYDEWFYAAATHSSLECKDCATPFGHNCTQDCCQSRLGYYSECVDHSYCCCQKNSTLGFDTGRCAPNFGGDYEMAVKVALGAAIIIAVGILLAILYNTVRQRTLNTSTTPFTRQGNVRRSLDSLQRLVEGLLLDRPPPYTINNDKPPTYDEAVQDYEPSATDLNGNTAIAIDMVVIPTVNDDATPPPPYSTPNVNPAFEMEPSGSSVEEEPFAILRIPTVSSQVQAIATGEMFVSSSHLACSHL